MKKILVITIVILALILISQSAKAGALISTAFNCNMQFVTVEGETTDDVGYIYVDLGGGNLEQVYFYPFNKTGNYTTWMRDDMYKYGNKIHINSGYFGGNVLDGIMEIDLGCSEYNLKSVYLPLTMN